MAKGDSKTDEIKTTDVQANTTISTTPEPISDLADLIGRLLPAVMRDRTQIVPLRNEATIFVSEYRAAHDFVSLENKVKNAKVVLDQLTNARLALEELTIRLRPLLEA